MKGLPHLQAVGFVFAAACAGLTACGGPEQTSPAPNFSSLGIPAAGHEIRGRIYPPRKTGAGTPGLLLCAASKPGADAFALLAEAAQREGYGAVILEAAPWLDRTQLRGEKLADAVAAGLGQTAKALSEAGVSPSHTAVVGEGRAAALALGYAATNEKLAAVVLLSPLLEVRGVEAVPAMERLGRPPVLLMAGRGDPLAMGALEALKPLAQGMCEVRVYGAGARGADLLNLSVRVQEQILLWLRPIVGEALQTPRRP